MEASGRPLVAILMGSDSDYPTMRETESMLTEFGIPYVTRISSAHRAPKKTTALIESLEAEGVEVFVIGAGLAAHLAGAAASVSTRPVIGVPMEGGSLRGLDALYSIVQMPSGVPVATMSIGKAGGYCAIWIGYADSDAEKRIRPVARWGSVSEQQLAKANFTWGEADSNQNPPGKAIRTGMPVVAQNLQKEPGGALWREYALRSGCGSCLALPLRIDDRVIGALNIGAADTSAFGGEEVGLLEQYTPPPVEAWLAVSVHSSSAGAAPSAQ